MIWMLWVITVSILFGAKGYVQVTGAISVTKCVSYSLLQPNLRRKSSFKKITFFTWFGYH